MRDLAHVKYVAKNLFLHTLVMVIWIVIELFMQVVFTPTAIKALAKIPLKDRMAMMTKLENYANSGVEDVIKLVGQPYFRLRHADWRAIFEKSGEIIVFR